MSDYNFSTEEIRNVRQYTLLDPDDCDPPHGLDLESGSRDSIKVEYLFICEK